MHQNEDALTGMPQGTRRQGDGLKATTVAKASRTEKRVQAYGAAVAGAVLSGLHSGRALACYGAPGFGSSLRTAEVEVSLVRLRADLEPCRARR